MASVLGGYALRAALEAPPSAPPRHCLIGSHSSRARWVPCGNGKGRRLYFRRRSILLPPRIVERILVHLHRPHRRLRDPLTPCRTRLRRPYAVDN